MWETSLRGLEHERTRGITGESDRFRFEGNAGGLSPSELTVTGTPRGERRSHPLITSVSDCSR
jgi:hypothetical protein